MQHSSWVVDGSQSKQRSIPLDAGREQMPYVEAFAHDEKTPKATLKTILTFNEMRQRLLDLGEMRSK